MRNENVSSILNLLCGWLADLGNSFYVLVLCLEERGINIQHNGT